MEGHFFYDIWAIEEYFVAVALAQFLILAQINIWFTSTFLVAAPLCCLLVHLPLSLLDPNPTRQNSLSWDSISCHHLLYLCCHESLFSCPELPKLRFCTLFLALALPCFGHGHIIKTFQSREKQHVFGASFFLVALLQASNHLGTKNYAFAIVRDITVCFRHGIEATVLFAQRCIVVER